LTKKKKKQRVANMDAVKRWLNQEVLLEELKAALDVLVKNMVKKIKRETHLDCVITLNTKEMNISIQFAGGENVPAPNSAPRIMADGVNFGGDG